MGGTMKRLAAKKGLQKAYSNQTQTPHELSNYCSRHTHNITFFYVKKNRFLTIRKKLQIDLISQLQYQEAELIIVSSHCNPVQSLQLLLLCPYLSEHTK
jgi:hypothetical protein